MPPEKDIETTQMKRALVEYQSPNFPLGLLLCQAAYYPLIVRLFPAQILDNLPILFSPLSPGSLSCHFC